MEAVRVPVSDLTDQELYVLIAEEAGEIVQCATKIMRFGLFSYDPADASSNNFLDLRKEYHDLDELMFEIINRADAPVHPETLGKKHRLVLREMP